MGSPASAAAAAAGLKLEQEPKAGLEQEPAVAARAGYAAVSAAKAG